MSQNSLWRLNATTSLPESTLNSPCPTGMSLTYSPFSVTRHLSLPIVWKQCSEGTPEGHTRDCNSGSQPVEEEQRPTTSSMVAADKESDVKESIALAPAQIRRSQKTAVKDRQSGLPSSGTFGGTRFPSLPLFSNSTPSHIPTKNQPQISSQNSTKFFSSLLSWTSTLNVGSSNDIGTKLHSV